MRTALLIIDMQKGSFTEKTPRYDTAGVVDRINQLSQIFKKFYRVNQGENISGTGLGLTVVKESIEAHGGNIVVSSEIGKGSKFSINLNNQIEEL